jgi:hypothetical protein
MAIGMGDNSVFKNEEEAERNEAHAAWNVCVLNGT